MGNKANPLVLLFVLMGFAIWAGSALITMNDSRAQWAILGVLGMIIGIIVVKKHLPIDVKLLVFCIYGYFIGAKGFAYLSPTAPFYIGELVLAACCLGYVLRCNGNFTKLLQQHMLISLCFIFLIFATIRVYFDYKSYGLYAIRDFAMVYYSLFTGFTFLLMRREKYRELIEKSLVPAMLIGGVIAFIAAMGGWGLLSTISLGIIVPHADVGGPLFTAVSVYFIYRYSNEKRMKWLLLAGFATAFLFTQKASYPFSFILTCGFLLVFARMRVFVALGMLGVLVLVIVLPLDIMLDLGLLTGSDLAGTIAGSSDVEIGSDTDAMASTTQWRLTWWSMVYEQVMADSPILGLGFGADITSPFLLETYGFVSEGQEHGYARYPHNVFFTVLGRLGWLGVAGLMIYVVVFVLTMIRIASLVRVRRAHAREVAMLAFVVAGFCNAFVQATYEAPFAAILHWIVLGYLLYWQRYGGNVQQQQSLS